MKIKSEKDFWSGLMFIVVGIVFAVGALNYSFGSSARPGPGYFPFGLGVLLAILGGVVLFGALNIETDSGEKIGAWAFRPLVWINLSVGLFGLALPYLGMFIALPILVVVSAMAGDEFHWKDAAVNAVVLTAGCWAVFSWALNLTIPLWPSFVR
ncbi:MAG: tripartite tricarboxylate transporter TctB family protein [Rubrivivax sp.]